MRLQDMSGDPLALGDDLVERLDHCRATHDQGARRSRPTAITNLIGIALHQGHGVVVDAELVADDLRKSGLVALSLAVRSAIDGHGTRRMHSDLGGLETRAPGAELGDHLGGNTAGDLDIRRYAQPT